MLTYKCSQILVIDEADLDKPFLVVLARAKLAKDVYEGGKYVARYYRPEDSWDKPELKVGVDVLPEVVESAEVPEVSDDPDPTAVLPQLVLGEF